MSFQLPGDLERDLRDNLHDLDREAKEAFLIALYRRGKISHAALSSALGIDRVETEEVLRRNGVTEDLGSVEDYLRDAQALEELRHSDR